MILFNKSGILPKLALPRADPYLIEKVCADNGTVAIAKNMTVPDRVNIKRLQPYHEEPEWNYKKDSPIDPGKHML